MSSIDPTQNQVQALLEAPGEGPILMLNLLAFNEQASYPDDFKAEPCTGAEAYRRYAEVAVGKIGSVGGTIEWNGAPLQTVIGPAEESWDACFVVRYPTKQAFVDMISDPEYQAAVPHRTASLFDSRLIRCADQALFPG